jgi:putative (di)nucleoside polyphosphate hydrolase
MKFIEKRRVVIDEDGFRPNVGIIICNDLGKVFWARRIGGKNGWQFPQGGIDSGETPEQALYRELHEEVGLQAHHVEILGQTERWLRYHLPRQYWRKGPGRKCVGQKQKWFLLRLLAADDAIQLDGHGTPEFDHWEWVDYWHPIDQVIHFKREVYRLAMQELADCAPVNVTLRQD